MKTILYVLGAPGIGKTTLVRALFAQHCPIDLLSRTQEGPKWTWVSSTKGVPICAAGHYTGDAFDGADRVPYNGAKDALEWWAAHVRDYLRPDGVTVLDGARFATAPSLARIRELAPDHRVIGVHLVGEQSAEERRARRSVTTGAIQNAAWVKGATTGAANFAAAIGATRVDAWFSPGIVALTVNQILTGQHLVL